MLRTTGLLALAGAALLISGCSCNDDTGGGLRSTQFPRLEVDPQQIVLNTVPVGQTTARIVTLRNAGGAKLRINSLDFSNATDGREFSKTHLETPFILDAGETTDVEVIYAPRDSGTDEGALVIDSTDESDPTKIVPIVTARSDAQLLVNPARLEFIIDIEGQSETKSVTVQNIGNVPVTIDDVRLGENTSPDFELGEGTDARPTIGEGESASFSITYTARGGDTDTGTLILDTDDELYGRIIVPLEALQPSPEIDVTPAEVIFGAVDLDTESDVIDVFIENLGNAPLFVDGIEFALAPPPINDQFTLLGLDDVEWPLLVPAEEHFQFSVQYHPTVDGSHRTAIVVNNNDADEAVTTVPVSGRVRRPCITVNPMALQFGRVALGQDSASSRLQIENCGDLPLELDRIAIDNEAFEWAPVGGGDRAGIRLEPLTALPIEVWYHNAELAEGAQDTGTLTIDNNTPDNPQVEVPLSVVGGGAPTCDLLVVPGRLNYGLVTRGRNVTRTLQLVNRGTGACELRNEMVQPFPPIPGFPSMFILTQPVGAQLVPPGAFMDFDITYRPVLIGAHAANYTATYWDPFLQMEKMATASLQGFGGESEIAVIPGHVDFGAVTAGECASREERVTVYNNGVGADLCIQDIRFEGECDEFLLVDRPVANADGCIIVTRRAPADFHLVYEPADLGPDDCNLIFVSDDPDTPELRVPLSGEGVADRRQTDIFEQGSGRTVDVLFVVDNSGSMQDEQENLRDNFGDFIRGAQQFRNDFQLGIITTDMQSGEHQGKLQGNPRIMRRGPNVEVEFERTVTVGTNGAGDELGLETAYRALSDPLIFDTGVACNANADCVEPDTCVEGACGGYNRGFLRDDAALELVFVSDEEDHSPSTLDFYVDFFKNIKGFRNEARLHASAIVGARNGVAAECNTADGSADAGRRYVDVANRTNGTVHSICDANFGAALRDLGNQAFGLQRQFFLSRPAVRASIEVRVDGAPVQNGWAYDEESNAVVFDEASTPQPGQTIRVDYEARCFPRRN